MFRHFSFFQYSYISCDYTVILLPYCIYTCKPVNYSRIKAYLVKRFLFQCTGKCFHGLLEMLTVNTSSTAIYLCIAGQTLTPWLSILDELYTHHQFIHHWVLFNCFWGHASSNHGAAFSKPCIYRCCCYGGKVPINTRKSAKVVQHTPDEWFSKEWFSANPNWVFFSKEV